MNRSKRQLITLSSRKGRDYRSYALAIVMSVLWAGSASAIVVGTHSVVLFHN